MREITTHHDGHGLNESVAVVPSAPGPGGASHEYTFRRTSLGDTAGGLIFETPGPSDFNDTVQIGPDGACTYTVGKLIFQTGPRDQPGSVPGLTDIALLAVVRDRLESFQAGEYPCIENEHALKSILFAMERMRKRAHNRAARGALGTMEK